MSYVLLVDDDPQVLTSIKRLLHPLGLEVCTALGGAHALEILSEFDVAVIVCDHNMPGMSGDAFLARSIDLRPNAVRITLTGNADLATARASINNGRISHFLQKPWNAEHLCSIVEDGVRQFQMQKQIRQLHELTARQCNELQEWNSELERKVCERTEALQEAYEETLDALVLALDSREQATAGHSRRVAIYALFLAQEIGVAENELQDIYRGALLHDIGKIGVPDAVLLKPGKLTTEERSVMEQHVNIGARFLERIGYLSSAMPIPRFHHERFDGRGYCQGLSGNEIPMAARIFAVIDVYDALRSERPYKTAFTHDQASQIISNDAGKHFDPLCVSAFLQCPQDVWDSLSSASLAKSTFAEFLDACRQARLNVKLPL